eukprot:6211843-Pleurochrysis_carterae.AAC.3
MTCTAVECELSLHDYKTHYRYSPSDAFPLLLRPSNAWGKNYDLRYLLCTEKYDGHPRKSKRLATVQDAPLQQLQAATVEHPEAKAD